MNVEFVDVRDVNHVLWSAEMDEAPIAGDILSRIGHGGDRIVVQRDFVFKVNTFVGAIIHTVERGHG